MNVPYVYYKVTLYKDMHPITGLGLPVINNEIIYEDYIRIRAGGSQRWSMPEIKRAQWQATKLAWRHPEMGKYMRRNPQNPQAEWNTDDKGISSKRTFFYEGEDGLYFYYIYLVKDLIKDTNRRGC